MAKRSEVSTARALLATKIAHTALSSGKARKYIRLTVQEAQQIVKVLAEVERLQGLFKGLKGGD